MTNTAITKAAGHARRLPERPPGRRDGRQRAGQPDGPVAPRPGRRRPAQPARGRDRAGPLGPADHHGVARYRRARLQGHRRLARREGRPAQFNGRLLGRSPLSDLEELELLRLGVEGKAAGWRTLRTLADADSRLDTGHLDELISRADGQSAQLEELRIRAASRVISHPSRPGPAALDPGTDLKELPDG